MKTILIIDDDPFISGIYKAKLDQLGYETIIAKDGLEGLKIARIFLPTLIILDLVLPRLDGFELLRFFKKNKTLKGIPVVVSSNLSERKDLEKALSLGAREYLIKAHYTPTEVVAKIENLINLTIKP